MNLFDDIIEVDELIRSRRKTISIIIDRDAKVIVRAPLRASMSEINAFISLKGDWIWRKKIELLKQINKRRTRLYLSGEKFLFMGKEYPLVYQKDPKNAIEFDYLNFIVDIKYKNEAPALFNKLYKKAAKSLIGEKLVSIAHGTDFQYNSFRINSARTRWGSCSSKKTLNFSYRLIMTPEFVIDYVIIHELSHTKEMNHSKKFWSIVNKHCPNYKEAEIWLTKNNHLIDL